MYLQISHKSAFNLAAYSRGYLTRHAALKWLPTVILIVVEFPWNKLGKPCKHFPRASSTERPVDSHHIWGNVEICLFALQ
jgi:hypothetical protein